MSLTAKQQAFVDEYLVSLNATQAAIKAGYSSNGASAAASRLLANVKVNTAIEEAKQKRAERTRVDADKVVKELAKLGFSDMRELATWDEAGVRWRYSDELTDEAAACVKDVIYTHEVRYDKNGRTETSSTKLQLHDKKAALKMLGDHTGVFGGGESLEQETQSFLLGADAMREEYERRKRESDAQANAGGSL